jgi:hypothetical protein
MTCPVSFFSILSLLGSFEFQTVNQQQMSLPKTNGPPAQEM